MKREWGLLKEDDYRLWDLKNEFSFEEAACLWFGVDPSEYPYYYGVPGETQRKIELMFDILKKAAEKGEIKGYKRFTYYDLSNAPVDASNILHRLGLRAYAESVVQKPLFIFPEERGQLSYQLQENYFCPPGTNWEDISFTLVNNAMVEIKTSKMKGRYTYHKIGMEDKRKGDSPKIIWELLKLFITSHGFITYENTYDPKLPETAKQLNKHLRTLFGISQSIYASHYKKEKGYRVRFKTYLSSNYNQSE